MNKNFSITFNVGYDQADTLIQIGQLEARIEKLKNANEDKSACRAYDMLLLRPAFFPPIKKCKPGFDTVQVDAYISNLKQELRKLELELSG